MVNPGRDRIYSSWARVPGVDPRSPLDTSANANFTTPVVAGTKKGSRLITRGSLTINSFTTQFQSRAVAVIGTLQGRYVPGDDLYDAMAGLAPEKTKRVARKSKAKTFRATERG